jgi:hypothetical protein
MPSAATLARTAVVAEGPGFGADAIDDTQLLVRRGEACGVRRSRKACTVS